MPDINYDARPKGMSKREYFAQQTGRPKEEYSSSSVKNLDDAKDFINSNQFKDAATKTKENDPLIRKSIKTYDEIVEDLTGNKLKEIKSPGLPNYEKSYMGLRDKYGISDLEDSLNELNSQVETVKSQFYVNKNAEQAKGGLIATNVVEGRVGEHEKAANERIMILDDQIQTINNQLNTAYGVIGEIMKYKSMDYDAAVKDYDMKFNAYMKTFDLVKGIDESIKSEQERQQDIARANLQIMYNSISENSEGWKSLSSSQQTMISKLELQAGLPQGFYQTIESKNPGGQVIATNKWQDTAGKEYTSVITRDKNGALKTQNIYVGQGKVSGNGDTNITASNSEKVTSLFDALRGGDGYISPEVWNDARKIWTGSTSDFDSRFRKYVNPADPYDYSGFEDYKANFKK